MSRGKRAPCDAIVLLGVELDARDEPTPELRARAREAARAYHAGVAGRIVACGGALPGHARTEADAMTRLLAQAGVPHGAIVREERSQDTMENMRCAAALLGGAAGRRIHIVTSDYHLHRAKATARRIGFRACGRGVRLPRGAAWWVRFAKERCYMIDLLLGWQDEGRSRPALARRLFARVFGREG